ncbi:hypothetical protein CASFOL_039424 [Castilleja foliolosa]|uniref:Uncharacterized protein n=1 Tax=Castilleja foliolosa TaxID=1961234 RepID=A0ABD3BHY8_9LAMI
MYRSKKLDESGRVIGQANRLNYIQRRNPFHQLRFSNGGIVFASPSDCTMINYPLNPKSHHLNYDIKSPLSRYDQPWSNINPSHIQAMQESYKHNGPLRPTQFLEGRKWPPNQFKEKDETLITSNIRSNSTISQNLRPQSRYLNISIDKMMINANDTQSRPSIVSHNSELFSLDCPLRRPPMNEEKHITCNKDWFSGDLKLNLSLALNNDDNINDHKGCSKGSDNSDINTKLSLAFTPHSSTAT